MKEIDLKELMAEVFGIEKQAITQHTNSNSIAEWDSMSHVLLVVKLESEMDSKLTPEEISRIFSVKDILKVFKQKGILPKSEDLLSVYKEI
jgi:acyl carrier protein